MDQYKIKCVYHSLNSFYHLAEHQKYRGFLSRLPLDQLLSLSALELKEVDESINLYLEEDLAETKVSLYVKFSV